MALLWGLAWAVVAIPLGLYLVNFDSSRPSGETLLDLRDFLFAIAAWGATGGAIFSLAFMVGERRHQFASISLKRSALWGFIGGAALPIGWSLAYVPIGIPLSAFAPLFILALFTGALGAGSAAGAVALARRAGQADARV